MTGILFIGVGTMGSPMVRNLTAKGFSVIVSDLNRDAARELCAETGATFVETPQQADDVDTVILMVPNSRVVSAVLGAADNADSLVRTLPAGTTVIDMSSSEPGATQHNFQQLSELGLEFVDAPVSGGRARAITGELAVMVGARDEAVFERILPILRALGTTVTRTGPVGSAHAMKALNNLLSVIGLTGALEILAVGTKFGLEPQVILDVLNGSTGRNHATEFKIGQQVISHNFDVGFSLALTVKDITIAQELARSEGIEIPVSEAAIQVTRDALAAFVDENPDQTDIGRYIEARTGLDFSQ
ncbi:MAG: NAD(P)-dependent oxidoreductase [Leucobacter sp.]